MLKQEYQDHLAKLFQSAVDRLGEDIAKPDIEQTQRLIRAATAVTVDETRFLRRPRAGADDETRVFFERLRWHGVIPGSSGSLWGPMLSTGMVDGDTWDKIDTLVCTIGILLQRYSASDRWAEVLGRNAS